MAFYISTAMPIITIRNNANYKRKRDLHPRLMEGRQYGQHYVEQTSTNIQDGHHERSTIQLSQYIAPVFGLLTVKCR